jgi:hypothetical protein
MAQDLRKGNGTGRITSGLVDRRAPHLAEAAVAGAHAQGLDQPRVLETRCLLVVELDLGAGLHVAHGLDVRVERTVRQKSLGLRDRKYDAAVNQPILAAELALRSGRLLGAEQTVFVAHHAVALFEHAHAGGGLRGGGARRRRA